MDAMFVGKIRSFTWSVFINAIDTIVGGDVAEIQITKDGLRVRAVDSAYTAMVDILLPKKLFAEYSVYEKGNVVINVEKVKNYIKHIDGTIEIYLSKKQLDLKTYYITRTFTPPDTEPVRIEKLPDIQFTSKIRLDRVKAEEFLTALDLAVTLSRYIKLSTSNGNAIIESSSIDGKDSIKGTIEGVAEGKAICHYPDYIYEIVKAICNVAVTFAPKGKVMEEIFIEFANDKPVKISSKNVMFMLAPVCWRD